MAIDADPAERVRRYVMQGDQRSLARADAEHRGIRDACRTRDGVQAIRLLASHLARSAFYVAAQLEPTYDTTLTRTALRMVLGDDVARLPKRDAFPGDRSLRAVAVGSSGQAG